MFRILICLVLIILPVVSYSETITFNCTGERYNYTPSTEFDYLIFNNTHDHHYKITLNEDDKVINQVVNGNSNTYKFRKNGSKLLWVVFVEPKLHSKSGLVKEEIVVLDRSDGRVESYYNLILMETPQFTRIPYETFSGVCKKVKSKSKQIVKQIKKP